MHGFLNVETSTTEEMTMEIYNLEGKRLWNKTNLSAGEIKETIDVRNWTSSSYIFKIFDQKGSYTGKVVKY